eukprot:178458-Chlamydomonas_euryale.AAC.5
MRPVTAATPRRHCTTQAPRPGQSPAPAKGGSAQQKRASLLFLAAQRRRVAQARRLRQPGVVHRSKNEPYSSSSLQNAGESPRPVVCASHGWRSAAATLRRGRSERVRQP